MEDKDIVKRLEKTRVEKTVDLAKAAQAKHGSASDLVSARRKRSMTTRRKLEEGKLSRTCISENGP